MSELFFCNIGWMNRYEGLKKRPDKIVGGGKYVDKHKVGAEICNFLIADDGYVYGHVETIKKDSDRKIRLESFGGKGDSVSGIDVVWTATEPDEGGRRVVGWYRNATVFRERQEFSRLPSQQHKRDQVTNYRICALAKDVCRLDLDKRLLVMGKGRGWMGRTPWWTPPKNPSKEIRKFIKKVRELLNGPVKMNGHRKTDRVRPKSPSTAADPYVRYVQAYEIVVTPRHAELQVRFENYLKEKDCRELQANVDSVDLRFRNSERGLVLAEIKPCSRKDVRYAIRTAIGQLFDYRQRTTEKTSMLIVLEVKPNVFDQMLATSNGFGIAFPSKREFKLIWPKRPVVKIPS